MSPGLNLIRIRIGAEPIRVRRFFYAEILKKSQDFRKSLTMGIWEAAPYNRRCRKEVCIMSCTEFTSRIVLSLVLGFLIGLERQLTGHPAGIRINVLICLGTSFFTLFPLIHGSDQVFRVGSSIISGVGFLCSGVIFKENGSVRGMNTAATLWCSAAIGILATAENPLWAAAAAAILIVSNLILRPVALKINRADRSEDQESLYRICVICLDPAEPEIRQMLISGNTCRTLFLRNLESADVIGGKTEVIAEFCSFGKSKNHFVEAMVSAILNNPKVVSAGWEVI